jgi:hypothetical protein
MLCQACNSCNVVVVEPFLVKASFIQQQLHSVPHDLRDRIRICKAFPSDSKLTFDFVFFDVFGLYGGNILQTSILSVLKTCHVAGAVSKAAKVCPARILLYAALLESEEVRILEEVQQPVSGFDLQLFNRFSKGVRPLRVRNFAHSFLSEPDCFLEVDLAAIVASGEAEFIVDRTIR